MANDDLDEVSGLSTDDLLAQVGFEHSKAAEKDDPNKFKFPAIGAGIAVMVVLLVASFFVGGVDLPFNHRSSLSGAKIPDVPLEGLLNGYHFQFESATLLGADDSLVLNGLDGEQVTLRFQCAADDAACPLDTSFHFPNPIGASKARNRHEPPTIEIVDQAGERETIRWSFTLLLKLSPARGGSALGQIYLCLPTEDQGVLAGHFEVRVPG